MNTLENKIAELTDLVSEYETKKFLGFISFTLTRIGERETSPLFTHLLSPQMQLFYLGSLHLKNPSKATKIIPSKDEWDRITILLKEIENNYFETVINGRTPDEVSEDERKKMMVCMPTFMTYFQNGKLSYVEQIIERIERTFKKYEKEIIQKFNLSLSDFIDCFDFIGEEINAKLNSFMGVDRNGEWAVFTESMISQGVHDPSQWLEHLPKEFEEFFEFMSNPGKIFEFKLNDLKLDFDNVKLKKFLDSLTYIQNPQKNSILYYTSLLPLMEKPVYKANDSEYLIFHHNQMLTSIYEMLYSFCLDISNGKIHKERDNLLENKTFEIFSRFFQKEKATLYSSYNLDKHSEQDILVISKGLALIIEVKAGKKREPMRDPSKSYDRIGSDFRDTIQFAYDQCLRVENALEGNENIELFNSRKEKLGIIKTKKLYNVFSIIVTLDRFGVIQNDLSHLLNIEDNVPYPWAVNIDDLEVFLLMLLKRKSNVRDLITFLSNRERLHGRLVVDDELDTCAMFYEKPKDFITACRTSNDTGIYLSPNLTGIIEEIYFGKGGLGFENERYLDLKGNEGVLNMGAPRKKTKIRMGYK